MQILQSATLQQHPDYSALVTLKTPLLSATLDQPGAVGTWDLTTDQRGRPHLFLTIKDAFNGQGSGDFAPEELQNDTHLTSRLHDLKGALQHIGSWRGQLQALFAQIRHWCRHLPGGAQIEEKPITRREERSGEYEVTCLAITSQGQTMRIEPIASWVVGADGRVDLKGTGGPLTLLYAQTEGGWFYLPRRLPVTLTPLTEALFLQLAEACLHG